MGRVPASSNILLILVFAFLINGWLLQIEEMSEFVEVLNIPRKKGLWHTYDRRESVAGACCPITEWCHPCWWICNLPTRLLMLVCKINHLCISSVAITLAESKVEGETLQLLVVLFLQQSKPWGQLSPNLVPHVQQESGLDPAAEL